VSINTQLESVPEYSQTVQSTQLRGYIDRIWEMWFILPVVAAVQRPWTSRWTVQAD